ncbi:MAG: hypothetical protein OXT67_12225 [Zetaproteobacteria bacterium]|nr:hypothetical protein [Zetaproteobacteria bacterium]
MWLRWVIAWVWMMGCAPEEAHTSLQITGSQGGKVFTEAASADQPASHGGQEFVRVVSSTFQTEVVSEQEGAAEVSSQVVLVDAASFVQGNVLRAKVNGASLQEMKNHFVIGRFVFAADTQKRIFELAQNIDVNEEDYYFNLADTYNRLYQNALDRYLLVVPREKNYSTWRIVEDGIVLHQENVNGAERARKIKTRFAITRLEQIFYISPEVVCLSNEGLDEVFCGGLFGADKTLAGHTIALRNSSPITGIGVDPLTTGILVTTKDGLARFMQYKPAQGDFEILLLKTEIPEGSLLRAEDLQRRSFILAFEKNSDTIRVQRSFIRPVGQELEWMIPREIVANKSVSKFSQLELQQPTMEVTRPAPSSSTPAPTNVGTKMDFDQDIALLVIANCGGAGCHGSANGISELNESDWHTNGADIARRIQLSPGSPGYMPLGRNLSPSAKQTMLDYISQL